MVDGATKAADGIERLRMTLKDIECRSMDHTEACRMAGEARRALEPRAVTERMQHSGTLCNAVLAEEGIRLPWLKMPEIPSFGDCTNV